MQGLSKKMLLSGLSGVMWLAVFLCFQALSLCAPIPFPADAIFTALSILGIVGSALVFGYSVLHLYKERACCKPKARMFLCVCAAGCLLYIGALAGGSWLLGPYGGGGGMYACVVTEKASDKGGYFIVAKDSSADAVAEKIYCPFEVYALVQEDETYYSLSYSKQNLSGKKYMQSLFDLRGGKQDITVFE